MALGSGGLHEPLGLHAKKRRGLSPRAVGITLVLVVSAAAYAAAYRLISEPTRDAPAAVATITTVPPTPEPVAPVQISPPPAAVPVEATGTSRDKVRTGDTGPLIINVPQALGLELPPAPDARLVEKGRYGPLPRVGADGAKPLDVYARPVISGSLPPSAPRIALVVGGMGLSEAVSRQAIDALPGAVTFGFAPYGDGLAATVAAARARGHEAILQMPMETFDQSASAGPHLLRTGVSPDVTLDDLHWLMSRFTGYVGVAGFLGGRFAADPTGMTSVLRDVTARGLLYFDDGAAARSLAPTLAPQVGTPFVRADVNLDGAGLDDGLLKLEALARANGTAIGVATGLPRSLDRLARFAQGLEARGIALVPLRSLVDARPTTSPLVRTP